ncbi:RAB GDP dissociation inhibitor alpha, putative [Trypanosoma cruzi marinkellei]|uniref:RAB GDP dissociation inhibitor alpha, putative n=1 Tax=Trypanosoma cruzi marinkellei TaxID=85056 RepID=K2M607_TRYCR|nr:RAB GDP dissociation inhibitor alpha, putative [Trypanosoma cruzi marinkellei]
MGRKEEMLFDDVKELGNLFAEDDQETEAVCPIEEMLVDRLQLSREGTTTAGFTPLLERFDNGTTAQKREAEERAEGTLAPLRVYFRNKRHSLWGHRLWNAAKYMVKRMDSRMIDVRGKTVLELGAGLGVPSLAAFRNGARCVVATDYPDGDLLEILEMNVKANCTADMIDVDAAAFLLQEAERLKLARGYDKSGETVFSEAERQRALSTRCVVEPLLWGKQEHIQKVLSYTGGAGFDIVLLSDILFNHICNNDLADTVARVLQRSQHAAAYCVFSHHRAHKQVEDLEFFDKCVARGLRCEQVDEENYPMMFPDDSGPVEIRQPVKTYKIVHYFDDAGVAFQPGNDVFDVVIQGTGMVESMVSAALARSGIRVLHCDGEDDYGGAFKTMTVERMREYITGPLPASLDGAIDKRDGRGDHEDNHPRCNDGVIAVDRMDELNLREQRCFLLDLLPTHYLSNGETVRQLIFSDMARHMEFQCFGGFFFMIPSSEGGMQLQSIPLSRAQVFATNHMSPLQKRRLMKFVKDVDAPLAEQMHALTADVGDDSLSETALERSRIASEEAKRMFAQEISTHPNETLATMIERKYGVSGTALDIVTLLRQLDTQPVDVLHSVELVRQVLTSVGAFGSMTPFIQPAYGTSEMPQNMCRIAAVWDATFVLRRSLLLPCFHREKSALDRIAPSIEMSNRQRVKAKVVLVPRTLASHFLALSSSSSSSPPPAEAPTVTEHNNSNNNNINNGVHFSRVIMVARTPLVSWTALRAAGCWDDEVAGKDDTIQSFPPLFLALCEVRPGVVVHIQQVSAASEQAPNDGSSVVVHFTANAREMGAEGLRQFVSQTFVRHASSPDVDTCLWVDSTALLFLASFTVREEVEALRGFVRPVADDGSDVSETRKAHPYAVEEYRKRLRQQRQKCGGDSDGGDYSPIILPVQTLFPNLIDDGAYLRAARQVYDEVVKRLQPQEGSDKAYTFFERLPPISGAEL